MSFLGELKRRKVIQAGGWYAFIVWIALQVADLLFDAFDFPPWAIQLAVMLLALGFPVVLATAWVYELNLQGLEKDNTEATPLQRQVRMGSLILVLLLSLGLGIILSQQLILTTDPAPNRSVAVLPFENLSEDPDNVYFSEGLSEELLNLLAGIKELRVPARTSSFSFKNQALDIPTIGRLLNVSHVLEGSVRKSDDRLRVTAQLISVEDGFHLWSQTYERTLDDIFVLQDDIASAVVAALRIPLLGESPSSLETDPKAYSKYLEALHYYSRRTQDGYVRAGATIDQALAIDENYVPALTLKSSVLANLALTGHSEYNNTSAEALTAVERALSLNPNYPNALSARAWLAMTFQRDFHTAAQYFRRALEIAPNHPTILGNASVLARTLGNLDRSIQLSRETIAINPVSSVAFANLADQLFRASQPQAAVQAAKKSLELSPGNSVASANLAIAYILLQKPNLALSTIEELDWPSITLMITGLARHSMGQSTLAQQAITELAERYGHDSAYWVASCYAWAKDSNAAFSWLNKAIAEGQPVLGINTDPLLASLHQDHRWPLLMQQLGFAPEQLPKINF